MFETLRTLLHSLRFRLAIASSAVLVVVLLLVAGNGVRLLDRTLTAQQDGQLTRMQGLFNATLAEPLEHRDLPALTALLGRLRQGGGIDYLVLRDAKGAVVASVGWDPASPLPPRRASYAELPAGAKRFDGVCTIRLGSLMLGRLHYGIPVGYAHAAKSQLLFQSTLIGWSSLILSAIALIAIGRWLTRDLRRLQRGVAALQRGESSVKLAVSGSGEIAELTRAFNQMAEALDERVRALQKSEAHFHAIADYTFGAEAWLDPKGRLIWVNRSVERVTGYTPQECLAAKNVVELLVYEKDRGYLLSQGRKALQGGQGQNFEIRLQRKDGAVIWVALNWQAIYDAAGGYQGVRVSVNEIQARKEAEMRLLETVAELRRAQGLSGAYLRRSNEERARLAALLDVLHIGVLFVDTDHRVIYCNDPYRSIWGFAHDENLAGMRESVLLERSAPLRLDNAAFLVHLAQVEASTETSAPFEITLVDGRVITEISTLVQGTEAGRHIGRVWTVEDVTERKETAERLTQLATRDPLTNLYNRRRFHEELERMLPDAARRGGQVGLLAIDLDGFKPVNDRFGHQAGDEVLVTLAQEVSATIRRNEMFFRLGGDEFAVLASDSTEEDMVGLARRVGSRIAETRFVFEGQATQLSASLGIALYPAHAGTAELLVAYADQAMYQAKSGGKNGWQVYRKAVRH
ncbi:MAG TPA: diguanylate cyclase [Rhodocyclaceae bacterium]|nr:diguanylate cyclase [Rhodocyclaceae bacterium]